MLDLMSYAWFDLGNGRQVYRRVDRHELKRSALPAPMFISDQMDPTEHPCDGREYDSKSAFRRVTKANGCVEVGNDPQRFRKPELPKPKGIRETIKQAANRVKNG